MFMVNGFRIDGVAGLVQLTDLAAREVTRSFPTDAAESPPPGLRGSQSRVLTMVPLEGGRRMSDLAAIANMTKQAMGEFVADLVEIGMVSLSRDQADGRAKLVSLTPAGRRAVEHADALLRRVEQDWADRLGAGDYRTLVGLLARVAAVELDDESHDRA